MPMLSCLHLSGRRTGAGTLMSLRMRTWRLSLVQTRKCETGALMRGRKWWFDSLVYDVLYSNRIAIKYKQSAYEHEVDAKKCVYVFYCTVREGSQIRVRNAIGSFDLTP